MRVDVVEDGANDEYGEMELVHGRDVGGAMETTRSLWMLKLEMAEVGVVVDLEGFYVRVSKSSVK